MANIELMKKLRMRFLRMRHADHFNMEPIAMKTECGSAMCIAGHTLVLAGYKMKLKPGHEAGGNVWSGRLDFDFFTPSGRKVKNPLRAAARELGLRYSGTSRYHSTAFRLFHDFELKTPKQAATRIERLIEKHLTLQ